MAVAHASNRSPLSDRYHHYHPLPPPPSPPPPLLLLDEPLEVVLAISEEKAVTIRSAERD